MYVRSVKPLTKHGQGNICTLSNASPGRGTACCDCWGMCSNQGPFIYRKQHINIVAI